MQMQSKAVNCSNVIVLTSGGLDSTACIKYYIDQGFLVQGVFINYGQIAWKNEFKSAINISKYFDINLLRLDFISDKFFYQGEIKGRNAFLIMAALMACPDFKGLICIGIHSGTPYYDCSRQFVNKMDDILINYTNGQMALDIPFIDWSKKMVYKYCLDNKVPIQLTYSCENGTDIPCGRCSSCLDRGDLIGTS